MKHMALFGLVVMLGCATMESLEENYARINWDDGINRNEAKLIAKKYLVDSKYEGDYQVWGPIAEGKENVWKVSFIYKSLDTFEQYLDVYVDRSSGEVTMAEERHKTTPALTYEEKIADPDPVVPLATEELREQRISPEAAESE